MRACPSLHAVRQGDAQQQDRVEVINDQVPSSAPMLRQHQLEGAFQVLGFQVESHVLAMIEEHILAQLLDASNIQPLVPSLLQARGMAEQQRFPEASQEAEGFWVQVLQGDLPLLPGVELGPEMLHTALATSHAIQGFAEMAEGEPIQALGIQSTPPSSNASAEAALEHLSKSVERHVQHLLALLFLASLLHHAPVGLPQLLAPHGCPCVTGRISHRVVRLLSHHLLHHLLAPWPFPCRAAGTDLCPMDCDGARITAVVGLCSAQVQVADGDEPPGAFPAEVTEELMDVPLEAEFTQTPLEFLLFQSAAVPRIESLSPTADDVPVLVEEESPEVPERLRRLGVQVVKRHKAAGGKPLL
mmetsp:Transcript_32294/g.68752  ORF Transcript_32294/g.68752 Transcript_32294/m.68752 type:complete len:358 (+) Transcript_32294:1033-2106(+)